jgi:hypothetical protein
MCKKEVCCLEITIAARFIGVFGLVSALHMKCINVFLNQTINI